MLHTKPPASSCVIRISSLSSKPLLEARNFNDQLTKQEKDTREK